MQQTIAYYINKPQVAKIPLGSIFDTLRRQYKDGNALLFITISPNPMVKITGKLVGSNGKKLGSVKINYGKANNHLQYKYIMKYLNKVYIPEFKDCTLVLTPELNKHGMLHVHLLVYSSNIQNDIQLRYLRQQVSSDPMTILNMSRKKNVDYMNNITFLNKDIEEVITYLSKDNQTMTELGFNNYCL